MTRPMHRGLGTQKLGDRRQLATQRESRAPLLQRHTKPSVGRIRGDGIFQPRRTGTPEDGTQGSACHTSTSIVNRT